MPTELFVKIKFQLLDTEFLRLAAYFLGFDIAINIKHIGINIKHKLAWNNFLSVYSSQMNKDKTLI